MIDSTKRHEATNDPWSVSEYYEDLSKEFARSIYIAWAKLPLGSLAGRGNLIYLEKTSTLLQLADHIADDAVDLVTCMREEPDRVQIKDFAAKIAAKLMILWNRAI